MIRFGHMVVLGAALAVVTVLAGSSARVRAGGQESIITANPAPTSQQIHSLFVRMVENQHRNDRELEDFERIEHLVSHKSNDTSDGYTERTDRIIPFGAGNLKLEMMENGSHVSPELYRHELQYAVTTLNTSVHPNDRYKQDLAKFEKRSRDRAELLDTALKAFHATWAGRETRGSLTLAKFILDPDPGYVPTNSVETSFKHIRAVVWLDESQAQIVRIEGDVATDITFGGGIVGKVYHGGHFAMENTEVEPGVWLPTLYTYDVDGRKFVFGFGVHERTDITQYRRVGPPAQTIELVRNELNNLSASVPGQ